MTHPDLGPELRQLAQAFLDRLDPSVRSAAAMAAESLRGPGRCQQVWCPVCALAALVRGEQHPMLTVIAEHSVTLMAMIRSMVTDPQEQSGGEATAEPSEPTVPGGSTNGNGRYHGIPIVIED
ncbi:MAG: hypothetical protein ACR2JI_14100 [Mycobacterium sp.]